MSSLTVAAIAAAVLLIALSLFFFNAILEGFKACVRVIRDVILFFSWSGLALMMAAVLGGLALFFIYNQPRIPNPKELFQTLLLNIQTRKPPLRNAKTAPSSPINLAASYRPPVCDEILDVKGRVFDYFCPHVNVRIWAPLDRIDPELAASVVMLEDDKFYDHGGLDTDEIMNALEKDLKAGKFVRGGSTITQQLAKNLFLSKEKSIFRKLEELPLALRLEQDLTKKQILELYLNTIEWGPGVFGAEAASRLYFDHDASHLKREELWLMALMIPNPKELNLWLRPKARKSLLRRARRFSVRLKLEKHLTEATRLEQLASFEAFLDLWAPQKPTATWEPGRRYPAAWTDTVRVASLPALWHKLATAKLLHTSGFRTSFDSDVQQALAPLLVAPTTAGIGAPAPPLRRAALNLSTGNAVALFDRSGPRPLARALAPWNRGPLTAEITELATSLGLSAELLPVHHIEASTLSIP